MKRLLTVAKYAWVVAMIALLGWYLFAHWSDFAGSVGDLGVGAVLLSIGALLLGKVILADMSKVALTIFGVRLSLWRSFSIYSLSQLGKYIPGSIWHFVGRVVLYSANGLPAKQGTKLLLLENYWLLGSAVTVGLIGCAGRLFDLAELRPWITPTIEIAAAISIAVLWAVALLIGTRLFERWTVRVSLPCIRIYVLGLVAWALFGLSFWALLAPEYRQFATLPLATGAFALGWAGGYVVVFAPAGLGVREAIIAVLMSNLLPVPEAVAVAALSRLVWTVTELALGGPAAWRAGPEFYQANAGNCPAPTVSLPNAGWGDSPAKKP